MDDNTCEYTNEIHATATSEFLEFIAAHGIKLEQAVAARQLASGLHNEEETPLFAKGIERKALAAGENLLDSALAGSEKSR